MLGLANVGAVREQVRGQAGWEFGKLQLRKSASQRVGLGWRLRAANGPGLQALPRCFGQGLAQQQHQRVLVERAPLRLLRQRDARALQERLGQVLIQLGAGAMLQAQADQLERVLACGQRLVRRGEQFFIGQHAQPALRHSGDQADLRGLAGIKGGQVLGQRLFLEAGDAAKEIKLIGRHGQPGRVAAVDAP